MKQLFRRLLALGTVTAMLGCGTALAAEGPAITVQLDGETLAFTDAAPQVKDERTFLPFRAVFEAMDAQVSYEGNVITAVRDGKTLTMTIGSAEAAVTENGVTTTITMDVAPYVDTETWRTYVPVRFAAQAFGCMVGWDQDASTVILIDTDKLLASALEGKRFTYLEKYLTYSEKFNEGIWDSEVALDGTATLLGGPVTFTGAASGTVADGTKVSMDMNMKMDLTSFAAMLQEQAEAEDPADVELPEEALALMDALSNEGIGLQMRGDLETGTAYLHLTSSAVEELGFSTESWYAMDLSGTYEALGMNYAGLLQAAREADWEGQLRSVLSAIAPNNSATDYTEISAFVEQLVYAFSDNGFQQRGDDFTATFDHTEDGARMYMTLGLTIKDEQLAGYSLSVGTEVLSDDPEVSGVIMDYTSSMDENDRLEAHMVMDLAQLFSIDMNMTGSYTPGTAAPETEPPAGVNIIPFSEMAEM